MMMTRGKTSNDLSGGDGGAVDAGDGKRKLPAMAVTSLCEIKFNRKDVKAMNTLMCRRLVAALYQVKVDADREADRQEKPRQSFPEFVPDQFVVLYGIKSLAIKNINEFLYGVRAERSRKNAKGEMEHEPLLMPFWRATHHGVPLEERMPNEDFDFYLDLLGVVAKTVGEEHTLKMPGIGAFWNLLGSMAEIQLPVFVLINVLARAFEKSHHDLFDRLKKATLNKAAAFAKQSKDPKTAPKPCPSYKPQVLGDANLDSRGFFGLEAFLALCLDGAEKQREKDAKILESIYQSWVAAYGGEATFDVFAECITHAAPELPENELIQLYQLATSGENPDVADFRLIEGRLRKKKIVLKHKDGMENVQAMQINDMKTMATCATLFGGGGGASKSSGGGLAAIAGAAANGGPGGEDPASAGGARIIKGWKSARSIASVFAGTQSLIRMIMMPPEDEGGVTEAQAEPSAEEAER